MPNKIKILSETAADEILSMITLDKRFAPSDKLPNENELAIELKISRTTLREAIRLLVAQGVLIIKRGKGTYVSDSFRSSDSRELKDLESLKVSVRDLYEMRLIFEPEAAYYAALRATESELKRILQYGGEIEEKIRKGQDRTNEEQAFHKAIAKATHNDFMGRLMPILYKAIDKGVALSEKHKRAVEDTIRDHRMIMDFLQRRDGEGARTAMKLHILHAIAGLEIDMSRQSPKSRS